MTRSDERRSRSKISGIETIDFTGDDKNVKAPQKPKVKKKVTVDICLYGEEGDPTTYIKTTSQRYVDLLNISDDNEGGKIIEETGSVCSLDVEDVFAEKKKNSQNSVEHNVEKKVEVKVVQNNVDNQEPQQQIDPINESIMDKEKIEAQKSKSDSTTNLTTEMLVELNDVQPSQCSKSPTSEKHDSGDIPYWESSSTTNSKSILDLDLKKKEITETELSIENDKKTTTPPLSPKNENPPPKPTKAPTSFFQDAYRAEDVMGLSDKKTQERHAKTKVKKHMPNYLEELENSKCLTTKWENRAALKKKPENHIVDLHELRRLASQGIPDQGSHRAVAWRVLLGYLPPETSKWEEVLHRDRTLYRTLISELFVQPSHKGNAYESTTEGKQLRGKGIENDGKSVLDIKSNKKKPTTITSTIDENSDNIHTKRNIEPSIKEDSGGIELLSDATKLTLEDREKQISCNMSDKLQTKTTVLHDSVSFLDTTYLDTTQKATRTASDFYQEKGMTDAENYCGSPNEKQSLRSRLASDADAEHEAIQERKRMTSNNYKANLVGKDAPVPVHTFEDDGALVPARIREQWKKSGRDSGILSNISSQHGHMNKLLVVDDAGYLHDGSRKDRITVNDNPLSVDNNSKWAQFFENASLLDEIRKDVVRTHPDLQFFLEPENQLGQRRYAAIERILFVWAKLNKGVRYVQGMNEIVGTLYFVLANDANEDWACEAEADTYFLFNTLMVEMRDVFVPDLDDADTGIQGRIANMIALLSLHDPEVRCHLDEAGIDPSFYSIRWLTTLLSREFCLPDTIRLWDSMFASTHKDNFLRYVCVTMVMIIREKLLQGDFGVCLRLLQSYPPTNVDRLLESSRSLWIYESQVTLACHKGGISLTQALATIAPPPSVVMAYGLVGGLAVDQVERLRRAGEKKLAAARGVARDASVTVATASRGFFRGNRFFDMFQSERKKPVKRHETM